MNEKSEMKLSDVIYTLATHEHSFDYMCEHDGVYTINNQQVLANYLKYYFQYLKSLYKVDILRIVNNTRNKKEILK